LTVVVAEATTTNSSRLRR